jgi:hypothetical protein
MDPASILADVQLALQLGNLALQLGQEAGPFLINAYDIAFNNKVLTADDRTAMQAKEASMRADIDAVIAADGTATV